MTSHFVPPPCGRQAEAGRGCKNLSFARAGARLARACSSPFLWRAVLAVVVAGSLPFSGLAQHHWHHGGWGSGSLSGLSCSQSTLTGTASDACTVSLTAAAGYRGSTVSLSSNSTAVAVPASVVVPRGATTASFTISASAVTSNQSVILTASAGGTSATFVLTLTAGAASNPALTVSATQVAFGSVTENSTATQPVTLTSTGNAALTISAVTVTGQGFSQTGLSFPLTLNPNQSATLDLQFDPTTAGAATGMVTISSNASNGSAVTVALTGTGQAASSSYAVDLSWQAPASSSDPVSGYNVYRATGSGSYQLLNTSVNQPTSFTDSTVQSGTTYNYEVTSVDGSGVESVRSSVYTASIP